jgi:predicted aconitase with swiveling domain
MADQVTGAPLTYGRASGEVMVLDEPISFWGGVDHLGIIADIHHPQHGLSVTGKVLMMTSSRGSSSGSFCLMELMRTDLAPAAIVMCEPDGIVCTGILVGTETYGYELPSIQLTPADYAKVAAGAVATVVSEPQGAEITW